MASIEGYGGRAGNDSNREAWCLSGLLPDEAGTTSPYLPGLRRATCANPKCRQPFNARQDGDDYCTEACDLDHNRGLKASQNGADLCETSQRIIRTWLKTR